MRRGPIRTLMFGLALVLVAGCSKNGGSDTANGESKPVGRMESKPGSSELMERSYGYLIEGDQDFTRLAPNYSTLRPFNPDSAIVVQTQSEVAGLETPPDDYQEYLHINVKRPMGVRLIVADSTGGGRIVYEWDELPEGEYTAGSTGWPVPQITQSKDLGWIYVYVVAGNRFRWRGRFALDKDKNLTPLVTESTAG